MTLGNERTPSNRAVEFTQDMLSPGHRFEDFQIKPHSGFHGGNVGGGSAGHEYVEIRRVEDAGNQEGFLEHFGDFADRETKQNAMRRN